MDVNIINEKIDEYFTKIIEEKNPLDYFSKFIAPEIAGCETVKKAILLMLVSRDFIPKMRNRIHIGLVGKPGTGKTVLMDYLEREHNAIYLTQDTTISALKGDARKKDYGVQIFKEADGGIVCFDEIELMEDRETLRDVMEKGEVVYSKGGSIEKYPAKVRVVIGSNSFKRLSPALLDRLDFVFEFKEPSVEEAKEIARKIVELYSGEEYYREKKILDEYLIWVREYTPRIADKDGISQIFNEFFDYKGEGKSGRWISKVLRIAYAYANLYRRDVMPEDIKVAIKLINGNGKVNNANSY
mgnify:CR=1 FL=1